MHDWLTRSLGFGRTFEHISILADGAGWALSEDARQLVRITERIGMTPVPYCSLWARQHVFCTDRYKALRILRRYVVPRARFSMPYYHGYPGEGNSGFDALYAGVTAQKGTLFRIQVTHERMRAVLLEGGIPPEKLLKIYIGVDRAAFTPKNAERTLAARNALGIPHDAVVIGTFQKDGDGWGEGLTPKLIKGPDIFCDALSILREDVAGLFVLLAGPARGYVKQRLTAMGIPFVHHIFPEAAQVSRCYHALDAYMICSRQEGGPKAVLECMSSGVPLVTTPVGQASELVRHGWNGLLTEQFEPEELAVHAARLLADTALRREIVEHGFQTAEENDYTAQSPLWKAFFARER